MKEIKNMPLDDLLNHKEKSLSHTKTAWRRFLDYLLNYVVLHSISHNILCLLISCLYILTPKHRPVKALNSFWHICKKSTIFIGAFSKLFLLTRKNYQKSATNSTKFLLYFLCGNFSREKRIHYIWYPFHSPSQDEKKNPGTGFRGSLVSIRKWS